MITILDFYVDEPACLGVSPYLSPYVRYVAGALISNGISENSISYLTVDKWREQDKCIRSDSNVVVVVAGFTVPGKYLGGKIGTITELFEMLGNQAKDNPESTTIIGGPIRFAPQSVIEELRKKGGYVAQGDIEMLIHQISSSMDIVDTLPGALRSQLEVLQGNKTYRDYQLVDKWAARGAFITNLHPCFPYIVNELETYRGCTRASKCSFCTEVFYGEPDFRSVEGVVSEVASLYQQGNLYFRLGRQADLLTYQADTANYIKGFPRPSAKKVSELYEKIRLAAPNLKMLHLDNINPGAVARFPNESSKILSSISSLNTPGDTAAMGIESVDSAVAKLNNLKCDRDEAKRAVELVNQCGSKRIDGIPKLLPGLNFIHGLAGETKSTFQKNFEFLQEILEEGLMLRRINIRQATIHSDTALEKLMGEKEQGNQKGKKSRLSKPTVLQNKFQYFRDRIRSEIDRPMLERVFPIGTVLREWIPESQNQGFVFGRQLGSYPVTIKVTKADPKVAGWELIRKPLDVVVTGYKERSLLGLTYPISVNRLGQLGLSQIPGIGKKRANRIFLKRPLLNFGEYLSSLDDHVWGGESDFSFELKPEE